MLHVEEIRPLRMPEAPHHRLVTIGIVVGIHIVVISAFLMGLRPPFFAPEKPDVCLTCISNPTEKTHPLPPPPTVNLKNPTLPTAAQPTVVVENDTPNPGPITIVRGDPTPPVTPRALDFPVRAIPGTHTIPDYPQFDSRVGHEGTVTLRLAINERGVVTDAVVEHSSGYDGLDQAAVNWVKAHWLYYPATHSGDPIASSADVTVTFRLTGHN
jgi:protein TonB